MENKYKLKQELTELKAVAETVKEISDKENVVPEFRDIEDQHCFKHALINFEEEVDEFNARDILPAFPTRTCYIPLPPDNGQFIYSKKNN